MTPKDPSLEPDPDVPGASGSDDGSGRGPSRSGRRPPGPGDLPISNLPPPGSADDGEPEPEEAHDGDGIGGAGGWDSAADAGAASAGGFGEVELDADEGAGDDGLALAGADDDAGSRSEGSAVDLEVEVEVEVDVEGEVEPPDRVEGPLDGPPERAVPSPPSTLRLGTSSGAEPTAPSAAEVDLAAYLDQVAAELEREDDPPPEAPEQAPEPVVPPVARRTSRPSHRGRRLVSVAALAAVVVFTILKVQQADDLADQRDDRRAVEDVARAFGAAYLTYDFEHVDRAARALHHLSTPAFAEAYAAQSAPGIQELFSSRQTVTTAETQEVFVGAVRRASARALVVVDVTATSATDGDQRLDDVSFVLDLARTGGGWKVAKVARTPQATLATVPPPAPTTTTTATPAAP